MTFCCQDMFQRPQQSFQEFIEEMVTDEGLSDMHFPVQIIPTLQLPSLVTHQQSESDKSCNHVMEAGER